VSAAAPSELASVAPRGAGYDCFVSYARTPDASLATAIRRGLAALAKPWYRRRAMRVFLDTASLAASDELEASIVEALGRSRFFILLASPEAADRRWVDREVEWWREHRDHTTFLIADTGARLRWDERLGDFAADSKVPPSLRGWFASEPAWTDLTWADADADRSLRNPRFSRAIAELAAGPRGISKDDLVDEDMRQHRRSLRLAWSAAGTLLVLAVAAAIAAGIAVRERHQALVQRDRAVSRALAALADATRSSDPLTSLADATRSLGVQSTPEGVRALRETLAQPLRRVLNLNERIDGLAFSPDGRLLAQAARGGVDLWDLRTGQSRPLSHRGLTFIGDFSFDPTGRTLAVVGQLGSVNVLQVTDVARPSRTRTIRFGNLADATVSPDGKTAALKNQAGTLALRDLRSGRTIVLDRHAADFSKLLFSADGKRLLALGEHGMRIWSLARPRTPVDLPSGSMLAGRFTTGGDVVGVSAGGTATTWTPAGKPVRSTRLAVPTDSVLDISPDGRLVAVGGGTSVVVWDLVSGRERVIGGHAGGGITAVAFGPRDRSVASAAEGDTLIRIWDLRTAPPAPARGGDFYATILTFSPRGDLIVGAEEDGESLAVWPLDGGTRRVLPVGNASILAAGFTRDGRTIMAVSDDGTARLVDAFDGRQRLVRSGLGPADVAVLSPDRRSVAVAVDGGPLHVWSLAGGPPVTLASHTRGIYKLAFSADGHIAATDDTKHVHVWDARGGPPIRLTAPEKIDLVDFGPTGTSLAGGSGATAGGIFLWRELDARSKPVLLGRHTHFVEAIAFSPDGSDVASVGDTGPVHLWDLGAGAGITIAGGTANSMNAIAFDRSGSSLATSDGTLRVLACQACGPPERLVAEANRLLERGGVP
jgi:WD40 repeat protein